jgi:outer membrane protein OmpA-like peptidoglycan-associated protein
MHVRWLVLAATTALTGCPGTGPGAVEPGATGDADGDGVAGAAELCPTEAEDPDGFDDEDGCPDPDNDADRIPDGQDACPREPEVYNGRDDDDGCPDCGAGMMLLVEWIQPAVWFDRGVDALRPDNVQALDAVVEALAANPAIEEVACLGTGAPEEPGPDRLASRRAQAVLDALVARGVEPERLIAWSQLAPSPAEPGRGGVVRFLLVRANGAAIRRWVDGGWEMADELGPPPDDGFPSCRFGTASWLGCDGVPFHVSLPREAECCDEGECRAACDAGRAVACRAFGLLRWMDVLRTDEAEVRDAFRRACELGDAAACGMQPAESPAEEGATP